MTAISTTTILRSRHSQRPDKVLSTLLLRYPRWIHAELMTHRVFSRNAASSRAIPVAKLIQDVLDNPAVPLYWGKNQKGMQATEECAAPVMRYRSLEPIEGGILGTNEEAWLYARDNAVMQARAFSEAGYHKQIVNRLLEPFVHITVLVSSTEWSNFLALRDHSDAEPHIAMLAREVRKELNREDNIQTLEPGEWHFPFIQRGEWVQALDYSMATTWEERKDRAVNLLKKLSVARCASTSYKTVDGYDMTLEKAIEIHDKLVGSTPLHASPAEHVAQAAEWYFDDGYWEDHNLHGNFEGFIQYRKMLPGECQ